MANNCSVGARQKRRRFAQSLNDFELNVAIDFLTRTHTQHADQTDYNEAKDEEQHCNVTEQTETKVTHSFE